MAGAHHLAGEAVPSISDEEPADDTRIVPARVREPMTDAGGAIEVVPSPLTSSMRSLERSFAILRVLRQSRVPLRLSDIARESGMHLATTQRILNVMLQHGYVSQEKSGYTMGIMSVLNGFTFLVTNHLGQVALPTLQELTASSGWTSSLSIRVGFSQVIILRVEGTPPPRYRLPVGEPLSLCRGAARMLATALDGDELSQLLDESPEIRLATGQVVSRAQFVEDMRTIREQGYVYGQSQRLLGAASVAAPIHSQDGAIVAALQVSALAEDLETKVGWAVAELQRASAAITTRLP